MMPVQPPQGQPIPQPQQGPPPVTIDYIQSALSYDASTGELRWKRRADQSNSWNSRHAGKIAGTSSHGYRTVLINMRCYPAHRVIWAMVTGAWPKDEIDHIDLDRSNNRWANLREASRVENSANRRGHNDAVVPFKGVTWHRQRGKYYARINVNKKQISLGLYETAEGAARAYEAAAQKYCGEFSRS